MGADALHTSEVLSVSDEIDENIRKRTQDEVGIADLNHPSQKEKPESLNYFRGFREL
jgi:hypothetical protein